MEHLLKCPRGCEKKRRTKILNLRGWKQHMNYYHEGWTEAELKAALAQLSPEPGARVVGGAANLNEFVDKLPDRAEETASKPAADAAKPASEQDERRKVQAEKAVKRMKESIAKLPSSIFSGMAERTKQEGWGLSKEESEQLSDSVESALEFIGIEFNVTPYQINVQNPLWILLYPIALFAALFLSKRAKYGGDTEDAESKDDAK